MEDGDFDGSKEMIYQIIKDTPWDNDAAFNAGWAKLSEGKIVEGYTLLDRGREKGPNGWIWGDKEAQSPQAQWRGNPDCTVMLRLERGLGDQFHQVRYARQLKAKGCTVIVSCHPQVAEVMHHADGVDAVVNHDCSMGVVHDYYFPAMSAPMYLGKKSIKDTAYIPRSHPTIPGRVGLCWQGNVAYEHQTKRKFPPELLFHAMKGRAPEFINLQKGEGIEHKPDWVHMVDLTNWTATARAVSSCEYVVTSCTSIAHISGAMGVPTFVILPMIPYYIWSVPGVTSPYYKSVTLFRQDNVDDWLTPFQQLGSCLEDRHAD